MEDQGSWAGRIAEGYAVEDDWAWKTMKTLEASVFVRGTEWHS